MNLCILIVSLLFTFFNRVKSRGSICSLIISDNEMASYKGGYNLIYENGIINENWKEGNTISQHQSSYLNDIEYFYATESHSKTENPQSPHQKIVSQIILIVFI